MRIENTELTDINVGDPVTYIPPHANGDASHPDSERGHIKSWNDTYVFVQYLGNTKATRPEDLIFG
jgi:hypothetical protein